ncbi:DUF2018 family protein [Campylobacter sp. faydin G-105]|uniref:DUF2018 family protein n=1 Tax=Campylobacter anatolicus TaxID=2829105 RepID=UPI001B9170B0|nr:DUF2018 family protein [Campylobacter anatolicus]MBR8462724.1 DUF2018 family protein [Campylobacter anatolicus]
MIDIFESTPRDKLIDIVRNASPAVVAKELERVFEELVIMREFCDKNGFNEAMINSYKAQNPDVLEDGLNDLYIALSGEILSQNE